MKLILYIVKDWKNVNKGLNSKKKYIGLAVYNIVYFSFLPISILPSVLNFIDEN